MTEKDTPTLNGNELIQVVVSELMKNGEFRQSLVKALDSVEANLTEMSTNYPSLERHVYAELRVEFERTLPPLPHDDLEALIRDEEGRPLAAFIDDLTGSE